MDEPHQEIALLSTVFPELHKMLRQFSLQRFIDMSFLAGLEIYDDVIPDAFIYGAHQSMIQIASRDLRITFKAHFNVRNLTAITARLKVTDPASLQKSLYDLFKEFLNLTAGGITQQLATCGVVSGISLPIATSGFDELIFSDELRKARLHDYWAIVGDGVRFVCSVYADVFESANLLAYVYHDEAISSGSGVLELI